MNTKKYCVSYTCCTSSRLTALFSVGDDFEELQSKADELLGRARLAEADLDR